MSTPPEHARRSLPAAEREREIGRAAPARIGPYVVERKLAAGGMGTVYLAHDADGGQVALKCLHPKMAERREIAEMFVDEARIASRIDHPNVCRVLDLGTADGRSYIAMEYLEGATVSALLRAISRTGQARAPHLPPYAARIAADACHGLHAAHELRDGEGRLLDVVHRDVSLRNVLVGYDGRVSVLDFGIARAADQIHETRTGVVKGTLLYMSPEQIRRKQIDRRSDVWAMGVVLWEMLTCRSLFRRRTELDALVAIERGAIPPPSELAPHVPPELGAIALRALARDRNERFASAGAMADALELVLARIPDAPDARALGAWARALVPPPRVSSAAVPVPRASEGRAGEGSARDGSTASGNETFESPPSTDPAALLPAWESSPTPFDRAARAAPGDGAQTAAATPGIAMASTRLLDGEPATAARVSAPSSETSLSSPSSDTSLPTPLLVTSPPAPRRDHTGEEPGAARGGAWRGPMIAVAVAAGLLALGGVAGALYYGLRGEAPERRATTLAEALSATPTLPAAPPATPTSPAAPPATPTSAPTSLANPALSTAPFASPPTETPAPTPTSAQAASAVRDGTRGREEASGNGTLRVVFVGGWATVSVDGRNLGSSPVQARLPAGRHVVTLLPMGRAPALRRVVTLRPGASVTVRVAREADENGR